LEAHEERNGTSWHSKLAEFYATIDLACEIQPTTKESGFSPFLLEMFQSEENFWNYAKRLQSLEGSNSESKLATQLAGMVDSDPLYFLVLMHLHRQIRFTNLELVNILFDGERLDDLDYYHDLINRDPTFRDVATRVSKSKSWSNYLGATPSMIQTSLSVEPDAHDSNSVTLASFKKVVTSYLGSEEDCWNLWESRIRRDKKTSERIARFVILNEDFGELVREKAIVSALTRSLRTENVESEKLERGEYGSGRVKEILEVAGFKSLDLERKDITELEHSLPASSDYVYITEIPWKEQKKKFDFVLAHKGKIGFVVETNYYSTSMSKIREVVTHFEGLKIACRGKYRLIYITDGLGWFNLVKTVQSMLEFECEELRIEPSKTPYLMNLELFRRQVPLVKDAM
jgi:hypothetical protein